MTSQADTAAIERSLRGVASWVEAADYRGYDPGDGLNSPLRRLAFGNRLAERVLLQVIWKSPVNLRPYVGIKPMESTKGRGYMARGYLALYRLSGDRSNLEKAVACLDWLLENHAPNQPGLAWGNHFDFLTRSGLNPAGSPIIVWTSLIGHAFLDAYEQLGESRYLEASKEICRWILALPREHTSTGSCLSYVPFAQSSIHNSNMLGAGMLARCWAHTGDAQALAVARASMEYSCNRQRSDGSWWYGEEPKYHWIDNFHTGYNLDSLKWFVDSTGDAQAKVHLARGLEYFISTFFKADGTPRYYHDRTFPIDIQCAAQGIETLAFCGRHNSACLEMARTVADWTIRNMQGRDGHFFYRRYPLVTARTPYLHWGQATMFKALATLLSACHG